MAKRKKKRRLLKSAGGRPAKLRDARSRARFLSVLRKFCGVRGAACRHFRISEQTLRNEEARDPEFAALVKDEEERALDDAEVCVYENSATDPRVALRLLERKRNGWQRREQITHDGTVNLQAMADLRQQRHKLLDDPDYLEFLRSRAIEGDCQPGPVRQNSKPGKVADGKAPCSR